jgi:hypothetical protein
MSPKFLFALLPAFLIACGGGDDDSAGTGGGGGTAPATGGTGGSTSGSAGMTQASGGSTSGSAGMTSGAGGSSGGGQCASGTLKVQAANNYTFASNITLTPVKVQANNPNLTFDWSGVTTDFLGRAVSPTKDIDSVLLVELGGTVDEFQKTLNDDNTDKLKQLAQGPLQLLTMNTLTSGNLQDFGVPGQPQNTYKSNQSVHDAVTQYLDPTINDPASHSFALMPSHGTDPGSGSRMILAFTIDTSSTTTSLALGANTRVPAGTNGHTGGTTGQSMSVTYDANIHGLTPIKVAAGDTSLVIDWSALTTNGLGRPFQAHSLGRFTIGHYTQTLTELENSFFDLETIGTAMYSGAIPSDDPVAVSTLKETTTGAAFPGIDNTGTWILALFCDTVVCGNPAPWFLTVLQTCN